MKVDYSTHIKQILLLGLRTVKNAPLLAKKTKKINTEGEKSLQVDIKLENVFIKYFKENKLPVKIFSEESGEISIHPNPKYIAVFDPLDGTTNYRVGKDLLQYGSLISIYKGLTPKLKDIVAAGAIEYSLNLGWIYSQGKTVDLQGNRVILDKKWKPHYSTPIHLDLYCKQGYDVYSSISKKLFIRNRGSTIGNLSLVLSNVSSGIGLNKIKPQEIGAVYALIKGAGGIVVNHSGKDLSSEQYSPSKTYQLLAGNKTIIDYAVTQLAKKL